jgi:hypothetical protein
VVMVCLLLYLSQKVFLSHSQFTLLEPKGKFGFPPIFVDASMANPPGRIPHSR